jgi:hypothetical protein
VVHWLCTEHGLGEIFAGTCSNLDALINCLIELKNFVLVRTLSCCSVVALFADHGLGEILVLLGWVLGLVEDQASFEDDGSYVQLDGTAEEARLENFSKDAQVGSSQDIPHCPFLE